MGGNSPGRREAVENKIIGPDKMMGVFFGKPSDETVERHKSFRKTRIRNTLNTIIEAGAAEEKLSMDLGMDSGEEKNTSDPDSIFSNDEREAFGESVRNYKEQSKNHVETCQFFLRSLRMREVFKTYYARWVNEYKSSNPDFNEDTDKDSAEFKQFIEEKGMLFIEDMSKVIVKGEVDIFVDTYKKGESADETNKKKDEFYKSISLFVERNSDDLGAANPEVNEKLKAEFNQILINHGYINISKKEVNTFFDNIVVTTSFRYMAGQEYLAVSSRMIELVNNKDISDEEWEEFLDQALKEKHPEIEEAIEKQNEKSLFSGSAVVPVRVDSGSAFESLGSSSGYTLRQVEGMNGVYVVDAREFKDKSRLPILRMVDNNDRQFDIEMPYGDDNAKYDGDRAVINGRNVWKWRRYPYGDFQAALNRQLLDNRMNTDKNIQQYVRSGENPNAIMKDPVMDKLAVNLFGFGLSQKKLQEEHLERFERLMVVLLKEGEQGGLEERIRQIGDFIANRNNANVLLRILAKPGSVTHNVDNIIRIAQQERMNEKSAEGGVMV